MRHLLHLLKRRLLNPPPKVLINLPKHRKHLASHLRLRSLQVRSNVIDKVILLVFIPPQDIPEAIRLSVVIVSNTECEVCCCADPLLVGIVILKALIGDVTEGGGVVGVGAIVIIDETGHRAVTLEGVEGAEGAICGNGLVVDAEAVAVGVRVAEEAGLKDGVGAGLDTRHQVRGGEGSLFDFGKVVLGLEGVDISLI